MHSIQSEIKFRLFHNVLPRHCSGSTLPLISIVDHIDYPQIGTLFFVNESEILVRLVEE